MKTKPKIDFDPRELRFPEKIDWRALELEDLENMSLEMNEEDELEEEHLWEVGFNKGAEMAQEEIEDEVIDEMSDEEEY